MARKSSNRTICCKYSKWKLRRRNGVFVADGRTNKPPLGRHSLGTKDRDEAMRLLFELDQFKAVELGLADPEFVDQIQLDAVELEEGWNQYRNYLRRPEIAGGVCEKSVKKYTGIVKKFFQFANNHGVTKWNNVTTRFTENYLRHLSNKNYADRTIYSEGTFIKQITKWMIGEEILPATCMIKLKLKKVHGTNTYCWTQQEVTAMIRHCRQSQKLKWIGDIIIALAHTGQRISELANLRWSDVDFEHGLIWITNDRSNGTSGRPVRRTKNRCDRSIPIHEELLKVLCGIAKSKDGHVFRGPRNGKLKPDVVRIALIRDVIKPLKKRFPTAEGAIGFEQGRLHSFRHFFCSASANAGTPEAVVMSWLGHKSSAMLRHYYHLNDSEAQQQIGRIAFTSGTFDPEDEDE